MKKNNSRKRTRTKNKRYSRKRVSRVSRKRVTRVTRKRVTRKRVTRVTRKRRMKRRMKGGMEAPPPVGMGAVPMGGAPGPPPEVGMGGVPTLKDLLIYEKGWETMESLLGMSEKDFISYLQLDDSKAPWCHNLMVQTILLRDWRNRQKGWRLRSPSGSGKTLAVLGEDEIFRMLKLLADTYPPDEQELAAIQIMSGWEGPPENIKQNQERIADIDALITKQRMEERKAAAREQSAKEDKVVTELQQTMDILTEGGRWTIDDLLSMDRQDFIEHLESKGFYSDIARNEQHLRLLLGWEVLKQRRDSSSRG